MGLLLEKPRKKTDVGRRFYMFYFSDNDRLTPIVKMVWFIYPGRI